MNGNCSFCCGEIYLSGFGYVYGGSEWQGGRYPSSVSRLYYIISGDQHITADGERIPLEAGKCYLIPSGFFFGCGCETHMENLYFHVILSDFSGIDILLQSAADQYDCGKSVCITQHSIQKIPEGAADDGK